MLPQLEAADRFDPATCLPLTIEPAGRIGWLAPDFARALASFSDAFAIDSCEAKILSPDAMQPAIRSLAQAGWISGWRNERYEVLSGASGEPLFTLERAAFRRFGLQSRAVHLNGWVRDGNGWRLWVARRSATKSIDPGMLDNLVGGGIGAGFTAWETLFKECDEEAGLPSATARLAVPAGGLRVVHAVDDGVHDESLQVFDLELPEGFAPANRDGEVAAFMLLSPDEVAARLQRGEFTIDAGVVTIDFMWRKGYLSDAVIGERLARLRREGVPRT